MANKNKYDYSDTRSIAAAYVDKQTRDILSKIAKSQQRSISSLLKSWINDKIEQFKAENQDFS